MQQLIGSVIGYVPARICGTLGSKVPTENFPTVYTAVVERRLEEKGGKGKVQVSVESARGDATNLPPRSIGGRGDKNAVYIYVGNNRQFFVGSSM